MEEAAVEVVAAGLLFGGGTASVTIARDLFGGGCDDVVGGLGSGSGSGRMRSLT